MSNYGGFWIRVVAYLIDTIILAVAGFVVGAVLGAGLLASMGADGIEEDTWGATQLLINGVSIVLGWLYFAILESSTKQGTVGKMALGLTVADLNGGQISFGRATGRYFAKWLSALILLIGFIMVAFSERKQGLHDIIAGTLVLKGRPGDAGTGAEVFS